MVKYEKYSADKEFLLFLITILIFLPVSIYVVHEIGHIIMQIILNVPVSFCFIGIDLTTNCGGSLIYYSVGTIFVVAISGFIFSLLPYKHMKNLIFISYDIKKRYGMKKIKIAIFYYYLLLCLGVSTGDFGVIAKVISSLL